MDKKKLETKEFKVYMPFSMKDDSTEDVIKIKGWANFCGPMDESGMGAFVDHAGDVIVPEGFDLKVWNKNPQILWQHNRNYTCGKGIKGTKKKEGLEVEAEVHKGAMEESDWYKVSKGLVSFFSVGFRTVAGEWKKIGNREVWFITKALLYEVSLVSVPCNSESGFEIIKAFGEDGSFYGGELGEQPKQKNSGSTENDNYSQFTEGEENEMKIKFKDTLSVEDVAKLESLGLKEKLEETVEVDIKEFITGIVKAELGKLKEAEALAEEEAKKELEAKQAEEAKAKQLEELAVELGVTVEEAKGFTEEEITAKRAEIEEAKKDETETVEKMKALLDTLDKTKNELTVE